MSDTTPPVTDTMPTAAHHDLLAAIRADVQAAKDRATAEFDAILAKLGGVEGTVASDFSRAVDWVKSHL